MLSKKEMLEVNAAADSCVSTVYLSGVSHSEAKMCKWSKRTSVACVKLGKAEGQLFIGIELYGVKISRLGDSTKG